MTVVAVFQVGGADILSMRPVPENSGCYVLSIVSHSVLSSHLGNQLTVTADALRHYQLGGVFTDRVHQLRGHGIRIVPSLHVLLQLSSDL